MDPRELKRILGEGGVREPNPAENAFARRLREGLEDSPLAGRPLRERAKNFFRPAVDTYVASLGGPLPYMRRLRQIDDELAAHEVELELAWRGLASNCRGDPSTFERRWRDRAARWNFLAVNDLIDRHNRYYPAEARLPMDPRTGDFVLVGGEPYWMEPIDERWVLERFPPALELAREAA